MLVSKDLQWIEEYIESASHLVPGISKLKRITSIHGRKDVQLGCYGQLWKYKNGHYRMSLYVNYYNFEKKTYLSTMDIVCTLAHELAHLSWWEHCTNHKKLEATITLIFMGKLKKHGYVSEEAERETIK